MPPVTVTRPGQSAAPPEDPEPAGPRVPRTWKLVAAGVVVAMIAAANVAAAHRQKNRDRIAADRVVGSAVLSGSNLHYGEGEVSLTLVINNAGAELQVQQPRVDGPGFSVRVRRALPAPVARGGTMLLDVTVIAPCAGGAIRPGTPDRLPLVVPVVPPSGRTHQLVVDFATLPLHGLADEACGYLPPEQALQPQVSNVRRARYSVDFTLTLQNRSSQAIRVEGFGGQRLALSVAGGLPTVVDAKRELSLAVRVAIPSCARLAEPLEGKPTGAPAFGAIDLELTSPDGTRGFQRERAERGRPLYDALLSLARQICPRSVP